MWDDLSPFLVGTGPASTVLDPDGTPNNILDAPLGGSVKVDWSFAGPVSWVLGSLRFTVTLYADPVGPGANMVVGSPTVTGPGPNYTVTIPVPGGSLTPDAYRLTTLITAVFIPTGAQTNIAGFIDGPIIQVRPGP